MQWIDVGPSDQVGEDEATPVIVAGVPIALFKVEGEWFALHDECTHGKAKLSDGFIEDGCVECPLHQGTFDIRTGCPRSAPVTEAVTSYPARVIDGRIQVALSGAAAVGDDG